MSRGFVKEVDGDTPEDLPELSLSPHPNYVTARGLAQLRARLAETEQRLVALRRDAADIRQQRALIERELRWLQSRIATAQLVSANNRDARRVAFGARVSVIDDEGSEFVYRLVGEDEADPDTGLISWTSPLARALIGARVGDIVTWPRPAGDRDIEVVKISYRDNETG